MTLIAACLFTIIAVIGGLIVVLTDDGWQVTIQFEETDKSPLTYQDSTVTL